jgi:hypothetical protein
MALEEADSVQDEVQEELVETLRQEDFTALCRPGPGRADRPLNVDLAATAKLPALGDVTTLQLTPFTERIPGILAESYADFLADQQQPTG